MNENEKLLKLEAMLQVALEAICSLAKETTGRSMVIGHFKDDQASNFGATHLSKSVKWALEE